MFDKKLLLEEAKKALQEFTLNEGLNILDGTESSVLASDLKEIAENFNQLSEENHAKLRVQINKHIKDAKLRHTILLAITIHYPLNLTDFTLEPIDDEDKMVASDGYQFNWESLFQWINEKKQMINPYTNLEFCLEDQAKIKAYAALKNVKLDEARANPNPLEGISSFFQSIFSGSRSGPINEASSSGPRIMVINAQDLSSFPPLFGEMGYWPSQAGASSSNSNNTNRAYSAEPSSSAHQFGLFNRLIPDFYMHKTVNALTAQGMTLTILKNNWRNSREFGRVDKAALLYLMKGKISKKIIFMTPTPLLTHERLTPLQAIAEINSLNKAQLIALQCLYGAGLRGIHLRRFDASAGAFGPGHAAALNYYIKEAGLRPEDAMDKISGLSDSEVNSAVFRHQAQRFMR